MGTPPPSSVSGRAALSLDLLHRLHEASGSAVGTPPPSYPVSGRAALSFGLTPPPSYSALPAEASGRAAVLAEQQLRRQQEQIQEEINLIDQRLSELPVDVVQGNAVQGDSADIQEGQVLQVQPGNAVQGDSANLNFEDIQVGKILLDGETVENYL